MSARVSSGVFVAVLRRRVQSFGGFATIVRKGDEDAGAIWVLLRNRGGDLALYGPAVQFSYAMDQVEDRKFELVAGLSTDQDISDKIRREAEFDPDLWMVELEDVDIHQLLEIDVTEG